MKCLFCDNEIKQYVITGLKNRSNVLAVVDSYPEITNNIGTIDYSCLCLGEKCKICYCDSFTIGLNSCIYIQLDNENHLGIYYTNNSFVIIEDLCDKETVENIDLKTFVEMFKNSEKIENYLLL